MDTSNGDVSQEQYKDKIIIFLLASFFLSALNASWMMSALRDNLEEFAMQIWLQATDTSGF